MFLSEVYKEYKHSRNLSAAEDIYIGNLEWFLPNFNWKEEGVFRAKCMKKNLHNLTEIQKKLCVKLEKQYFKNLPTGKEAYTVHHWIHTYAEQFQVWETVKITRLRPDVTFLWTLHENQRKVAIHTKRFAALPRKYDSNAPTHSESRKNIYKVTVHSSFPHETESIHVNWLLF